MNTAWQSPWVRSSTEDIIAFLDSLPKSHLSLDRKHFIVIDKTLETDGAVWCYRNKDWGNDEESEDYPAAQLGRRGLTRFALPAPHAAGTLYPMLTMDWEECLAQSEEPYSIPHEDRDWWSRDSQVS